jgi:hypothetical protein
MCYCARVSALIRLCRRLTIKSLGKGFCFHFISEVVMGLRLVVALSQGNGWCPQR